MLKKVRDYYDRVAQTYDRKWDKFSVITHSLVLEQIGAIQGLRIVDFGCGTGLLLEKLRSRETNVYLSGVDISMQMLTIARNRLKQQKVTLRQINSSRLPFGSNSIDVVLSISNLHHLDRPLIYLEEFKRILRYGGRVVLVDWCTDFLWQRCASFWRKLTTGGNEAYSLVELEYLLKHVGFTITYTEEKNINWYWGIMLVQATKPRI